MAKNLTVFTKTSIKDAGKGPKYAFLLLKLNSCNSRTLF